VSTSPTLPKHLPLPNYLAVVRRIVCVIIGLSVTSGVLVAQDQIPTLEQGKPIERELAGDAAHSYRIALTAGQYLHVVVEQKGIDAVVALFAPDGKKIAEVDRYQAALPLLRAINEVADVLNIGTGRAFVVRRGKQTARQLGGGARRRDNHKSSARGGGRRRPRADD